MVAWCETGARVDVVVVVVMVGRWFRRRWTRLEKAIGERRPRDPAQWARWDACVRARRCHRERFSQCLSFHRHPSSWQRRRHGDGHPRLIAAATATAAVAAAGR